MVQDNDVRFRLQLLEHWQLFRGRTEIRMASRQQRLVSALAIYGPRNRRFVSGLLWPDSPEPRALESLRVTVHHISHQAPGLLANGGPVLSLTDGLSVDIHQCLELVRTCEQSGSSAAEDACLSSLLRAELLPGWYEDWVILEQNRLRIFRLRALIEHARRWLHQGDAEQAADVARNALVVEPLQESCVELLMRAELQTGNRAGALFAYESFRVRLSMELGVGPSDYLIQLAAAIRSRPAQLPLTDDSRFGMLPPASKKDEAFVEHNEALHGSWGRGPLG